MFYWQDVKGYKLPPGAALDIGSAIHEGIAAWLRGESVEQAIQDSLLNKQLFGECLGLMKGYIEKYAGDVWFKDIISIEREFNIPLLSTSSISVTGRMDVVVRKNVNEIHLVEHKTAGKMDSSFFSKFRRDLQNLFYTYAVYRLYGRIDGMLVDALVKTKVPQYVRGEIQILDGVERFTKFEADLIMYHNRVQACLASGEFLECLPQCYVYGECAYLPLCLRGEHPTVVERYQRVEV